MTLLAKLQDIYDKNNISTIVRNLMYNKILIPINNQIYNGKNGSGESILQGDWDNIIILDACRYDEFIRASTLSAERVESRISVASQTPEFLFKTFSDRQLHDTVYVTANPEPLRFADDKPEPVFHSMVSALDKWDSESMTVHPKDMPRQVESASEQYPNKRMIAHFMQPHMPPVGPTAEQIQAETGKVLQGGIPRLLIKRYHGDDVFDQMLSKEYEDISSRTISYEELVEETRFSRKDIVAAYRETLETVWEVVPDLIKKLDGKTVVTADHGECLGEQLFGVGTRLWGHPGQIRTDELCKVPWVEFDATSEKQVVSETPELQQFEEEKIEKRLRAFGYR